MSREKIVRTVAGRLSLREPQSVSLERLHNALESVPALRDSKARSAEELSAMLAAVAVAMAARRFMQRHLDACAMLRCLGLQFLCIEQFIAIALFICTAQIVRIAADCSLLIP